MEIRANSNDAECLSKQNELFSVPVYIRTFKKRDGGTGFEIRMSQDVRSQQAVGGYKRSAVKQ